MAPSCLVMLTDVRRNLVSSYSGCKTLWLDSCEARGSRLLCAKSHGVMSTQCTKCCVCALGTAQRWTSLLFLLFVKQQNRGAFRFAAHTNARENKSQEVALNAPVSAGYAGDLSDETRVICVTITK